MGRIIIRQFRGTETARNRFVNSVTRVLDTIRQSRTGRILLEHIEATPYPVLIYPFFGEGPNATANSPTWERSGTTDVNNHARGERTEIEFHPTRSAGPGAGGSNHETLFHELAHAYRYSTGTGRYNRNAANTLMIQPFGSGFENIEELFAITITNIYSSELRLSLRSNHGTGVLTDIRLMHTRVFREQYRIMYRRMPQPFIRALSNLRKEITPFNPFIDIRLNQDVPFFDRSTYVGPAQNYVRRGILISAEEAFMEYDWQQFNR
ncbi:M91 family zinc metallopeptidase [uncultured Zobellia sp.]|uniref:M91 family zinc metallopeptidase n=1 Tax=uncultured Zobellia sp. TaxID=255433 RepID=UPI0025962E1F|nr:M91 family zinc metallopeptidase [uncultured Zobellia sp.]